MSRIAPLAVEELPEATRRSLTYAQELMGFTPNDVLTMARWPELLAVIEPLVAVIYAPGEVDPVLKRLVATLVSGVAGCRYCQAHTAHGAVHMAGGDAAKIAAVWEFESSPLFSAAERAALDFAFHAAQQPGAATDAHFATLRGHYSERGIMELVAMISLFGFLNRWNDTLATPLEDKPLAFARATLSPDHWEAGKHASAD
jgi:uncharacterized peroxidase-related enzyme